MNNLIDLTLSESVAGLQSGDFSSQELVRAYLQRIERLDDSLHTYLSLLPEQALAQAEAADRRLQAWRKGQAAQPPPLLGAPLAVKDVLCVEGAPTTCGSRILENFIPPFTATAVARLQNAGAIVLGKTNTDEFAMGSSTENSAYGLTHNPWDQQRVPGGSSGGSAAAVAARLAPAALGTDTGGSVRQPASFCGVTGLKPTYGSVSRYGLVAFGSSLDVIGVLGRDARDVALVFQHMAGRDPLDASSVDLTPSPFPTREGGVKGLRIGVPKEYFIPGLQAEVEQGVRAALALFESLGAELIEVSLPHTEYALPVYYLVAPAEASANLARYDGIRYGPRLPADELWQVYRRTRGQKFGPEVKRRIMLGTYALSAGYYDAYYGQAQKVRTLIRQDFERGFQQVDVIAAPSTPSTAFVIGEHSDDPLAMYLEDIFTIPANLAGIPGLAFPVGFDQQGLPVGMQLMAPHFREDLLLGAAHTYQQVTDWHRRMPPDSRSV
jgi:aspartyl-tRNA(Asn)/glutamyl-tRNA(Gln) amidotransferase subunit A